MHKLINILLVALISFIYVSCSGIKMLSPEEIYDTKFLNQIRAAHQAFTQGQNSKARSILATLKDSELKNQERAKKYNLEGIIYFTEAKYEKGLDYFIRAKNLSVEDQALLALINLNIASTLYKQNKLEMSWPYLQDVVPEGLSDTERRKYFQLKYLVAKHKNDSKEMIYSLISIMSEHKSFEEIEHSSYKEALIDAYSELSATERTYILQKYEGNDYLVVGFLAKQEVLKRFYSGDKAGGKDVLNWIESHQRNSKELMAFVEEFKYRMDNYSKLELNSIGVILPLTGKMESYGQKALQGIEVVLNSSQKNRFELHVKDNQNNAVMAKNQVEHLVRNKHVSVIIGGLFPTTAKEEYLEAKKYGVLYLSLSQVFLNRSQKDHLLIEIPGSIQSQVARIFSDDFLNKFGKKVAFLYPNSERGQVFADEVWKFKEQGKVELSALESYEENVYDYRNPVKKLLGLYFSRERKEEFNVWKDIYSVSKHSSIRRIQTLRPMIDFDWVLVPSYPQEAIQIIPSFSYFDANNLTFIGGPSWMSQTLIKERKNLSGKVYFIGDDPQDYSSAFDKAYRSRYGHSPKLIETLGFESLNIVDQIFGKEKISSREDLEQVLLKRNEIPGITGNWKLVGGNWIKEMDVLAATRKSIVKVDLAAEDVSDTSSTGQ